MKRQKHYTSEEMIIKDIDAAQRRVKRLLRQADANDATADLIALSEDPSNVETIRNERLLADMRRAMAKRLEETRLVKLENTLAAFRSELLPGMTGKDVVLQSK